MNHERRKTLRRIIKSASDIIPQNFITSGVSPFLTRYWMVHAGLTPATPLAGKFESLEDATLFQQAPAALTAAMDYIKELLTIADALNDCIADGARPDQVLVGLRMENVLDALEKVKKAEGWENQ